MGTYECGPSWKHCSWASHVAEWLARIRPQWRLSVHNIALSANGAPEWAQNPIPGPVDILIIDTSVNAFFFGNVSVQFNMDRLLWRLTRLRSSLGGPPAMVYLKVRPLGKECDLGNGLSAPPISNAGLSNLRVAAGLQVLPYKAAASAHAAKRVTAALATPLVPVAMGNGGPRGGRGAVLWPPHRFVPRRCVAGEGRAAKDRAISVGGQRRSHRPSPWRSGARAARRCHKARTEPSAPFVTESGTATDSSFAFPAAAASICQCC